jgi:hypothetical protein
MPACHEIASSLAKPRRGCLHGSLVAKVQTPLHCCGCGRHLWLNDRGVLAMVWCQEFDEADEVSTEQSLLP